MTLTTLFFNGCNTMILIPNYDTYYPVTPTDEICIEFIQATYKPSWERIIEHYPDISKIWIPALYPDGKAWPVPGTEPNIILERELTKILDNAIEFCGEEWLKEKLVITYHPGPVYESYFEKGTTLESIKKEPWYQDLIDDSKVNSVDDVNDQLRKIYIQRIIERNEQLHSHPIYETILDLKIEICGLIHAGSLEEAQLQLDWYEGNADYLGVYTGTYIKRQNFNWDKISDIFEPIFREFSPTGEKIIIFSGDPTWDLPYGRLTTGKHLSMYNTFRRNKLKNTVRRPTNRVNLKPYKRKQLQKYWNQILEMRE